MLSYGRVVGQLSRITRHAHAKNSTDILHHVGFVNVGCMRYSSKSKKGKPVGTTAKVEECIPPKEKQHKKVPPLPQDIPPPPIHANVPPEIYKKPPEKVRALCDDRNYMCPPSCQPGFAEECYKPPDGPRDPEFKYWKHLIAAIILAGVSVYAYIEWFKTPEEKEKKTERGGRKAVVKNPTEATHFPEEAPYLLIGGGTAAFSAFRSIKAADPTAKVLVVTKEGDYPYMRPPLSKELWYNKNDDLDNKLIFRQWNGTKRSLFYEPPEFYLPIKEFTESEKGGVSVATGWTIKRIDVLKKTAYLELDGNEERAIKYDKCLIATGATPKNLEVFDEASAKIKEKIIVFRTKEDYLELVNNMKKPNCKRIVVIGGGLLGSELSTSLARNLAFEDQKVIQIYKENNIMAQVLPEYLCNWSTNHIKAQGVECLPNTRIHDVELVGDKLSLTFEDGSNMIADQVIVAIGVEANTNLGKASNLEIDPEQGGLLVNAELEARSNVWVAGDVACFYDVQLGRRRIEHHDHAVISGRLAGENMTGAGKPYVHQSMFWSDLGPEVGFEAIGIIDSTLETVGVFAKEDSDKNVESANEQKSKSETKIDSSKKDSETTSETKLDDYGKGVIFYLRDNIVVGIVLWNIYGRMSVARRLLARNTKYDELNEAAKLFAIHDEDVDI